MRWIFLFVILAHAGLHFLGFAKAFGYAELSQLSLPISRNLGLLWLAATLVMLLSGALLVIAPRVWWASAALAIVLSQVAIVSAWEDARFGTVANLLIGVGAVYGFAAHGPFGLRAEYEAKIAQHGALGVEQTLTESELSHLPQAFACYLRRSGAVGRPRTQYLKANWRGRIRGGPQESWMSVQAEQYNFLSGSERYFFMDARRAGLPIDVFHTFEKGAASMRVRLLSLFEMVNASGPALTRSETVTWLNDLCVLAPDALLSAAASIEALDARSVRVHYTLGANQVSAVLPFNEACELVDFISDDREKSSADGRSAERMRWSTPLRECRSFGARYASSQGRGVWHAPQGAFDYIELELTGLSINGQ
jgi:hypothetical protein